MHCTCKRFFLVGFWWCDTEFQDKCGLVAQESYRHYHDTTTWESSCWNVFLGYVTSFVDIQSQKRSKRSLCGHQNTVITHWLCNRLPEMIPACKITVSLCAVSDEENQIYWLSSREQNSRWRNQLRSSGESVLISSLALPFPQTITKTPQTNFPNHKTRTRTTLPDFNWRTPF